MIKSNKNLFPASLWIVTMTEFNLSREDLYYFVGKLVLFTGLDRTPSPEAQIGWQN